MFLPQRLLDAIVIIKCQFISQPIQIIVNMSSRHKRKHGNKEQQKRQRSSLTEQIRKLCGIWPEKLISFQLVSYLKEFCWDVAGDKFQTVGRGILGLNLNDGKKRANYVVFKCEKICFCLADISHEMGWELILGYARRDFSQAPTWNH